VTFKNQFSQRNSFYSEHLEKQTHIKSNQIKSNLFVTLNTDTNERSKTKSNVPTGHKGSKELH